MVSERKERRKKAIKIKKFRKQIDKPKINYRKTIVKYVKIKWTLYKAWVSKNKFMLLRTGIFLTSILLVAGLIPDKTPYIGMIDNEVNGVITNYGNNSFGESIVSLISSVLFISSMLTAKIKAITYNDLNDKTREKLIKLGYKPSQLDNVEDGLELFVGHEIPKEKAIVTTLLDIPEDGENMLVGTKRVMTEFVDITKAPVEPVYKEPKEKENTEKEVEEEAARMRRGGPMRR